MILACVVGYRDERLGKKKTPCLPNQADTEKPKKSAMRSKDISNYSSIRECV